MSHSIEFPASEPDLFAEVARLWNDNAGGRHSFFPWSGERLAHLLTDGRGRPIGRFAVARDSGGELAGFLHYHRVHENGYPNAGVVEALLVDGRRRQRGIGTALLEAGLKRIGGLWPEPTVVDALGAWPFGYAFNTLADGSERSGVFLAEPAVYRLFRRAGFEPVRKSIVMRAELHRAEGRPLPPGYAFFIDKRSESTWLDRVFRGRTLWDHELVSGDGRILSRAIFGLMEGESRSEGRALFSLFGVNTPPDYQGRGFAGLNLSHMMAYVRDLGAELMELHVYADNAPALALYRGLGFQPIAETMMMHKRL